MANYVISHHSKLSALDFLCSKDLPSKVSYMALAIGIVYYITMIKLLRLFFGNGADKN